MNIEKEVIPTEDDINHILTQAFIFFDNQKAKVTSVYRELGHTSMIMFVGNEKELQTVVEFIFKMKKRIVK
jgi:hypothetical protein